MAGISFINSATANNATASTSFTITKPTNTLEGDFMIAIVATADDVDPSTITCTESNWTTVRNAATLNDTIVGHTVRYGNISILTRFCGASDPSTWTGTISDSMSYVCHVASYRGCSGILVEGEPLTTTSTGAARSTNTVVNTQILAWRFCAARYTEDASRDITWSGTGTETERQDVTVVVGADRFGLSIIDSAGAHGVMGNVNATAAAASSDSMMAWCCMLGAAGSDTLIVIDNRQVTVNRSHDW